MSSRLSNNILLSHGQRHDQANMRWQGRSERGRQTYAGVAEVRGEGLGMRTEGGPWKVGSEMPHLHARVQAGWVGWLTHAARHLLQPQATPDEANMK